MAAACRPNRAHYAIAALERQLQRQGRRLTLISQNVDRFHQQAGSQSVIELHGRWEGRGVGGAVRSHICMRAGNASSLVTQLLCKRLPAWDLHVHHSITPSPIAAFGTCAWQAAAAARPAPAGRTAGSRCARAWRGGGHPMPTMRQTYPSRTCHMMSRAACCALGWCGSTRH